MNTILNGNDRICTFTNAEQKNLDLCIDLLLRNRSKLMNPAMMNFVVKWNKSMEDAVPEQHTEYSVEPSNTRIKLSTVKGSSSVGDRLAAAMNDNENREAAVSQNTEQLAILIDRMDKADQMLEALKLANIETAEIVGNQKQEITDAALEALINHIQR